jgi:hypothetical protein
VRRGDFVAPRQIGNRPRDFEDAMERPRAQLKLLRRRAHQRLTRRVQLAYFAHIRRRHVCVAHDTRIVRGESLALPVACRFHSRGDDGRWLA